ncbi:transcription elongation factor GreAB [Marinomonas sp.]
MNSTTKQAKMIDKSQVYEEVLKVLAERNNTAQLAAKQAYEAATNSESVAENKYDTFGLEASYLAHGQSQRLLECQQEYLAFTKWQPDSFGSDDEIKLGALVSLLNPDLGLEKHLFIAPIAGGLSINIGDKKVLIISPSSPVARAIWHKSLDSEVELPVSGQKVSFCVEYIA